MNWRRSLVAVCLAVPLLILFRFGLTRDPRAIPSPLPGRAAPDFSLAVFSIPPGEPPATPRLDTVRLRDLKGKVVVLNFWASWCLACRDEHRVLSEVATRMQGEDVRFFGVLYSDTPDNGRRWISMMGGQSYPGLLDPDSRTAIDYGLYGVPETFFIGRDGRVAYKQVGPVTEIFLVGKIRDLLMQPVALGNVP
ncbi:MAG TPA: redoxin domain-containing protein [Gemmatimonadaceae bacterium]|nr:redoxin domain-containing protein [Gemmatimonadaceae bacterium]